MPYQVFWYIENRVIGTRFYGDITATELATHRESLKVYIQTGIPPLFLLIDMREVTKFPLQFNAMLKEISEYRSHNHQIQHMLVLSSNRLINFFNVLAARTVDIPVTTFKTQEEADTFLAAKAPDLATSLPSRKEAEQPD